MNSFNKKPELGYIKIRLGRGFNIVRYIQNSIKWREKAQVHHVLRSHCIDEALIFKSIVDLAIKTIFNVFICYILI